MQIYDALKRDHQKVKSLFIDLLKLDDDSEERHEIINQIRDELIPHARAEEAVFYNSLRALNAVKDVVRHSYKEHVEAETLLKTLQAKNKLDFDWKKTARSLKEALDHHIEEEEQRIFPVAQQVFSTEEAGQLGEAFEKMKPEIREQGFIGTTIDLIENLMPPRFSKAFRGEERERRSGT